jgi:hypothetical protein
MWLPIGHLPGIGWDVCRSSQRSDARAGGLLEQMRTGEYYRAYVAARTYLKAHPASNPDAWIMVEATRKRGSFDDLISDATALESAGASAAGKVLVLRALNLSIMHEVRSHSANQAKLASLETQERSALLPVEALAPSDITALSACLGCHEASIVRNRALARSFVTSHPDSLEGSILLARSLIKGRIGSTIGLGASGKTGSLRSLGGEEGPKIQDGLDELERAQKRFGTNLLIVYYRAQALSLKADTTDPKDANVESLHREALAAAAEFVKGGKSYPRMYASAQKFLANKHSWQFFPFPDE